MFFLIKFHIHVCGLGTDCVCAFINEAESTVYEEAVTQRATWTLCPVTPPLTLLCRFTCVSDTHRWPSSRFDQAPTVEREHKAGFDATFVRTGWKVDGQQRTGSVLLTSLRRCPIVQGSTSRSTKRPLVCTVLDIFCCARIRLSPAGCCCNALLFADIRDVVCLP